MSAAYRIDGPALVSFSGGRTSGYMLKHILDAWGGSLPDDVRVVFANTGKERPETLDFVRDCSAFWGVRIHWLEWAPGDHGQRFTEVNHNNASRLGEPFQSLIGQKGYLPNPVTRFCTIELKIRVMRDFARSLGWEKWTNIVGLRADEPGRVGKALDPERNRERWTNICPLADARVTERDVLAWWKNQPFDLRLQSHEGNCDLCFLKSAGKISRILEDRPDLADWWIAQEGTPRNNASGERFRTDRPSYAEILSAVRRQERFDFGIFDDHQSCVVTCHD